MQLRAAGSPRSRSLRAVPLDLGEQPLGRRLYQLVSGVAGVGLLDRGERLFCGDRELLGIELEQRPRAAVSQRERLVRRARAAAQSPTPAARVAP